MTVIHVEQALDVLTTRAFLHPPDVCYPDGTHRRFSEADPLALPFTQHTGPNVAAALVIGAGVDALAHMIVRMHHNRTHGDRTVSAVVYGVAVPYAGVLGNNLAQDRLHDRGFACR